MDMADVSLAIAGTGLALAAIAYGLPKYFESHGILRLPAPSFKPVGPSKTPSIPGPEQGIFAQNTHLHKAENLFKGQVLGSESVAISPDGFLYMLDKFGNVLKATPGSDFKPEKVTHLGPGRPLGFHFKENGDLFICNAGTGLQVVEKSSGKVVLLSSVAPIRPGSKETSPILYANDLSIAKDGGIYFTDSTDIAPALNAAGFYDTMASYVLSVVQGDYSGRLLHYSPEGKTTCIADNLFYANGVELTSDESAVLVNETCLQKVTKIWLKGPKAGSREVFLENLPGYCDGITKGFSRNGEGRTYWISLIAMSQPMLENFLRKRFTRWLIPQVPPSLKKMANGSAVLQVSEDGKILRYMGDPSGDVTPTISAVTESKDGLFFGNLGGDCVSFLRNSDYSPILT